MSVNKLLDLPDGPRTIAFRAIERILREDEVLSRVVAVWRTRDGSGDDGAEPSNNQCPIIGLSPVPVPDSRESINSASINMQVAVQLIVEGRAIDDLMNLWDAVVRALYLLKPSIGGTPVGQYLRCMLPPDPKGQANSVSDLFVTQPAFSVYLPTQSTQVQTPDLLVGEGRITFSFLRPR